MAECPGVAHLAAMADGGLARIRTPGGALSATQARAIAEAAEELGSGIIDLTNRANLQLRGLALDAGAVLVERLIRSGLAVDGLADRRRNILLDPLSGLEPVEIRDCRPLAAALDDALSSAPWIGDLSPKFSFALDGGGTSGIAGVASDVTAVADAAGFTITFARHAIHAVPDSAAWALATLAQAAASVGPNARAADLPAEQLLADLCGGPGVRRASPVSRRLAPTFGVTKDAVILPVPVGRLDVAMMRWLAERAETDGDGALVLAPWSAVVLSHVQPDRGMSLLTASEAFGFTPVAVAERLRVAACAGAPACERAREPAKALGAAILALAAEDRSLLPTEPTSLHLSACPRSCASSAAADVLLLGDSGRDGWTTHRSTRPRFAGPSEDALDAPSPRDILALLG